MRETLRKGLIRSVLQERKTILLDELRWVVLGREAKASRRTLELITKSQMNSFARTVRDHVPDLSIWEIGLGDGSQCPSSVIAATAVYRLHQRAKLDEFLGGPSPTVECRYVTDLPVAEFGEVARYARGSSFATPQYHLHLVDLYAKYENDPEHGRIREWVGRIKIPPAHKVTIVCANNQKVDFEELSRHWRWQTIRSD